MPVPAILLLAAVAGPDARAATGPAEAGVELRCLALQYREGAAAYRDCAAGIDGGGASSRAALSFDDRHAIERACGAAPDDDGCIETQLTALEQAGPSPLDALGAADRRAVGRECAGAPIEDGVAAYRRCLDEAFSALDALPAPALGALSLPDRAALALRCAGAEGTAAGYRRCQLESLGVTPEGVTPAPAAADAPSNAPAGLPGTAQAPPAVGAAEPGAGGRDPDAPAGGGERPAAGSEADDALDASVDAAPTDSREPLDGLRERLLGTISALDVTERIVLAAALALPLLLLAVWAVGRGARSRRALERQRVLGHAALRDRFDPTTRADESWSDDAWSRGGDGLPDDFFDDTADTADIDRDGTTPDELERDRAAFVALDDDERFDETDELGPDDPLPEHALPDTPPDAPEADGVAAAARTDEKRRDDTPRSAFGRRLLSGETGLARRHAIEFLIYWMAYADERYAPETRRALLDDDADDGDPQVLIKRHVLEEDTLAFADVVRWLQSRCDDLERVQILDLLMALLVGEGAMTPAQNTLLHFLADAFGLGAEGLDQRHEEAFGRPMPPLARVDLAAWWRRVDPDLPSRWDAHAIAALDEREQDRIRLGLPSDAEIDEAAIVGAFHQAARRCQPHRFDALGERERALAERQLEKFGAARDRLLGVSA